MRLLGNRVAVKPIEGEYAGAVLIPDAFKDKSVTGEVVHVGTKISDISVGQKVMYLKDAGIPLDADGQKLLMLSDNAIYAVE